MKYTNFSMVRGDTLAFGFEIEGVDDIENAYFSCKKNKDDTDYTFQKSLGDGIYKVEDGKYGVRIPPSATNDVEIGQYYYDLQIQVNLDIYTVLIGRLNIVQEVTKEGL